MLWSGRLGLLCFGLASYGVVWQAWRVMVRQGTERFVRVRHGRCGLARLVPERFGKAGKAEYGGSGCGSVWQAKTRKEKERSW